MDISKMALYDLGILWALGSNAEKGRFVFRSKEAYFLERLKPYFENKIYAQKRSRNRIGMQYVLKTSSISMRQLYDCGWTERNAESRDVPILDEYKDFLRAYIEIHSSLDYSTRHKRDGSKYRSLRLRIYGNIVLLQGINAILSANAKVGIKTIKPIHNNKTSILCYSSLPEIASVFSCIHGNPRFPDFWDDVSCKLRNPTKEYETPTRAVSLPKTCG